MPPSPRTERRLTRQVGRTSRCFIMMTSAVPPAMSLASPPNCFKSWWTSLRLFGVRYSKGCMVPSLSVELVRLLDRLDDLVITGAAAEVVHHPILDLLFVGLGDFVEQRLGRDHLPRLSDAALQAAVLDEALLHRVELAVFRQPLDRGDLVAVGEHRRRQAGAHHLPVHQHRAGAADADAAAFLGAGEAEIVAQKIDHQPVGRDFLLDFFPVDARANFFIHAPYLSLALR